MTTSNSDDDRPRITSARELDCLRRELIALMAEWENSANPVLRVAAGQLRATIMQGKRVAFAPLARWEERQDEEGDE